MAMRMIQPRQIKKIHVLKKQLGFDDDTYRAALLSRHNVQSCKALTYVQAAQFIAELEKALNFATELDQKAAPKYKYDNLRGRDGMATPRQLRKIEAMWADVSRAKTDEERTSALRRFLKRIVGVEDLRFLEIWQVKKVIKALEAMRESQEQKKQKEAVN